MRYSLATFDFGEFQHSVATYSKEGCFYPIQIKVHELHELAGN